MKKFTQLMMAFAIVALGASCSKDETASEKKDANASLTIKSTGQTSGKKVDYPPVFDQATMVVESISFEGLYEDVNDRDEFEFEGKYAVNLLTGSSNPELPLGYFPLGEMQEIEIELYEEDDLYSVHLIGKRKEFSEEHQEGKDYHFEVRMSEDFEFESEAADGEKNDPLFRILPVEEVEALIQVDLNQWMKGVVISEGTANNDGVVVISENQNKKFYEIIKENIEETPLKVKDLNFVED